LKILRSKVYNILKNNKILGGIVFMSTFNFYGRDFINAELDYTKEEWEAFVDVSIELKRRFKKEEIHSHILQDKTLFMIFYNQSLRTSNSFETGMTQLGGHANNLVPGKIYTPALEGEESAYSTERISDVARVLNEMGQAISIRMYGDPVDWIYGKSNRVLKEFAQWSDIPVINMECDKYHPTQAVADMVTVKEKFGGFKGVKFVMSWAYSSSTHKPRAVPQSLVLAPTKMGMDVVLAHPKGFELDPKVMDQCKKFAQENGSSFEISNNMKEAFEGADVVYPKAWCPVEMLSFPEEGKVADPDAAQKTTDSHKDWICNADMMKIAKKDAYYMHCLPADRGMEVTDEVIDGPQSIVFEEAGNRMHSIKAILAMTMGKFNWERTSDGRMIEKPM
jgi:ornithine carbamoyltransferase